jgi:hypothetical protein
MALYRLLRLPAVPEAAFRREGVLRTSRSAPAVSVMADETWRENVRFPLREARSE